MECSVAYKIHQNPFFGRGTAPDPAGGAHDAPPDPLVGWGGDTPPTTLPHWHQSTFRARHASPRISARSTPMEVTEKKG